MAVNKNGIVVIGAVFVDIKGFPEDIYIPDGRNAGESNISMEVSAVTL
ncbi:MAG: hypothetical protein ACLRP8_08470 [Roseburia intestinalis]